MNPIDVERGHYSWAVRKIQPKAGRGNEHFPKIFRDFFTTQKTAAELYFTQSECMSAMMSKPFVSCRLYSSGVRKN
jgi:hypothetical protein